jgi:hypothetical protein
MRRKLPYRLDRKKPPSVNPQTRWPKHLSGRWQQQKRTEPDSYSGQHVAFEQIFQQSHLGLLCPSSGAKSRPHRNS